MSTGSAAGLAGWLRAVAVAGTAAALLCLSCQTRTKESSSRKPAARPAATVPAVPAIPAAQPTAARRQVLLEIDQMQGTPPLPTERVINGVTVTLKNIYAEAGIDLDVRPDQMDLPRKDALTLADMHAMMLAYRSLPPPPGGLRIHVLVATTEQDEPDVLGEMFDFGDTDNDGHPREGFAILADAHRDIGVSMENELLLTAAHELAHCLNLHHADWDGGTFSAGSTIESYSMADTVRWHLSPSSLAHLGVDPYKEIWPDDKSLPFGLVTAAHAHRHKATPNDAYDIVDPDATARAGEHVHPDAGGPDPRSRSRFHAPESQAVKLRLESPKPSYQIGEPVVLTVALHNEGAQPALVVPLLAPEHRFLAIEVRAPGSDRFESFQPAIVSDRRGTKLRTLQPGESLHAEARIFFGSDGWTFGTPGTWTIRADYPVGFGDDPGARLQAAPIQITIAAPQTETDRRAQELVGGRQQGIYLLLGGADHLKTARANLTKLVSEYPDAAQAPAARLALGTAALHPTIDVATKVQSPARLDEAQRYLKTTLNAPLSPLEVGNAQAALAEKLQRAGRTQDANQVRASTVQKLGGAESAKKAIERIQRVHP